MTRYPSGKIWIDYLFDGHTEEKCGLTDVLANDIQKYINNEYDSVVTVIGDVGTGKSNQGVDLAESCDPTFTLEERYVYDFLPFLEKLDAGWDELKPGMCFLMDEATNVANNRNWNDAVNKYFTQFLEMFRSLGLILILIIPTKQRLDIYLREGTRTRYLIEVQDLPNCGKYEGRGYYKLTVTDKDGTHYVGMGTFDKMNTDVLDAYMEKKKASQRDKLKEMIAALSPPVPKDQQDTNPNRRNKEMALWFIIREGWSYADVSKEFNIPEGTLRRWMKEHRDSI